MPPHGGRNVQPELRLPSALHRGLPGALRPECDRPEGAAQSAARDGEHPRLLRSAGQPAARTGVAAALLRGHGDGLPARSAACLARSALPWHEARALAGRVSARPRRGAARRGSGGGPRPRGPLDRAGRALGRNARVPGPRGDALPAGAGGDVRRVLAVTHGGGAIPERGADPGRAVSDRDLQDDVIRALADAPYRESAAWRTRGLADPDRVGRFARFLARHFYHQRVVHFFKYSRALTRVTGRRPEAVLTRSGFEALVPSIVLGSRQAARAVAQLVVPHVGDAGAAIPYLGDLLQYEAAMMIVEAGPRIWREDPESRDEGVGSGERSPPERVEGTVLLELAYDLPVVLPQLLQPWSEVPQAPARSTALLVARSPHGRLAVARSTVRVCGHAAELFRPFEPARPQRLDRIIRRPDVGALDLFTREHVASPLGRESRLARKRHDGQAEHRQSDRTHGSPLPCLQR